MANQKLGEFINSLALKAGLNADSPELKAFLADPACLIEIDSKISDVINSGLMNETAALNNKKILDTLVPKGRAEAYNNIDETFNREIMELLDETDKTTLKGLKFSTDRVAGLKDVIVRLKEAKKDSKTGPEKDALQKQLDDTLQLLKTEKQARADFETKLKTDYERESIDTNLKFSLIGRKWRLPTETEADKLFAAETALNKIKSEAAAKGYKLVRDENGNLQLRTSENLKVIDPSNHTEVGLNQFIDGAVSSLIAPKTEPETKLPQGGGSGNNGQRSQNLESAKANMNELLQSFDA